MPGERKWCQEPLLEKVPDTFTHFPVQEDGHLLTLGRYVERHALRARLVKRAERWRWCSLWHRPTTDTSAVVVRLADSGSPDVA
jgi:hypothetical protein